jgi:hypothetical protein
MYTGLNVIRGRRAILISVHVYILSSFASMARKNSSKSKHVHLQNAQNAQKGKNGALSRNRDRHSRYRQERTFHGENIRKTRVNKKKSYLDENSQTEDQRDGDSYQDAILSWCIDTEKASLVGTIDNLVVYAFYSTMVDRRNSHIFLPMMLPGYVDPAASLAFVTTMYLRFLRFQMSKKSWESWDQIFKLRHREILLSAQSTAAEPLLSHGLFQR